MEIFGWIVHRNVISIGRKWLIEGDNYYKELYKNEEEEKSTIRLLIKIEGIPKAKYTKLDVTGSFEKIIYL